MTSLENNNYEQDLTTRNDFVESALRGFDQSFKEAVGTSFFHVLTLASIGGSIALYASGKKNLGIFIGLWAPTFQALKAAAENSKEPGQR